MCLGAFAMVAVGYPSNQPARRGEKIKKPMMFVRGKKSPTIALSDRLISAAPKAKPHVVANAGRFPMLDGPSAFAAL
jgi:pimeloyl-ACP methyl ester carboxylesterase